MPDLKTSLFIALGLITVAFSTFWFWHLRKSSIRITPWHLLIGLVTDFFDTLGIGSFAPTTAIFKLKRLVQDDKIPGTLNIGHFLPTIVQAYIYISWVEIEIVTLVSLIVASMFGMWLGAGVVVKLPQQKIQLGMGAGLLLAAFLIVMSHLNLLTTGGTALALFGTAFVIALLGSFVFGALMSVGIGLYAPCFALVTLLGMSPLAAFPIMMGSCAFLMPVGGVRFVRNKRYDVSAALGLTLGGIPGVLLAAFVVKSLPLGVLRILVVLVIVYTALMMLRSALSLNVGLKKSMQSE